MADQHWTQPVKDVSISVRPDRDFPIITLTLCEDDPEGPLHLLHFFTDGWIHFSVISRRSSYHATLMLGEVYPDVKLYTRALHTFTISSLLDVSTTRGATNYYQVPRGEFLHHLQLPRRASTDVSSPLQPPAASTLEQWLPRLPGLHHRRQHNFRALGVKKGPGEKGHGEERGHQGGGRGAQL